VIKRTSLTLFVVVACGAAFALMRPTAAPARAAAICLRDGAGYATYGGGLRWNTEFFLRLAMINESDWYGDWQYWARRYDAYFNETYWHFVDVAAGQAYSWTYTTSSNVYRRTSIATASSYGIPHWAVSEYGIC
jgi:hypothetical protein